jgi:putative DNA primase/helicase
MMYARMDKRTSSVHPSTQPLFWRHRRTAPDIRFAGANPTIPIYSGIHVGPASVPGLNDSRNLIERTEGVLWAAIGIVETLERHHGNSDNVLDSMTADERLKNILLSTKLGPVTPYYGVVNGICECGKPKTEKHKPGKHPRSGGWQGKNATTDHATITEWCRRYPQSNFAIIAGVQSVVLDLDIRPGKNGVAEMEQIEAAAGKQLPRTVTALTGSGGKHLYFAVPPGLNSLQKPKNTNGIDFQRNRQGVIVPGSLHESGNYYNFAPGLSPADIELADLPDWLLSLMRKDAATTRTATTGLNDIGKLFDELLKIGPPPGSLPPGRLRPDEIVMRKMKTVPMRKYPDNRSHSDSHWAWTLARNCCHHWDQYLRIWKESPIRKLPDTKCGRASYEASILEKAFLDQKQQWKNPGKRPVEDTPNPPLAKYMRNLEARTETPRSPVSIAVVQLNYKRPDLDDNGIARMLNATGQFEKPITREHVKHIRYRYRHLWRTG